jgi:hypothetical protein
MISTAKISICIEPVCAVLYKKKSIHSMVAKRESKYSKDIPYFFEKYLM